MWCAAAWLVLRIPIGRSVLTPGEVVEFDTHVPHWFSNCGRVLSLFGPQGERMHLGARSRAGEQ